MLKLEAIKSLGGFEAVNLFASAGKKTRLPFTLSWSGDAPTSCIAINLYNFRFSGIFFALAESALAYTVEESESEYYGYVQGISSINSYDLVGGALKTLNEIEWGDVSFSAPNVWTNFQHRFIGSSIDSSYEGTRRRTTTQISSLAFSGNNSIKTRNGFFLTRLVEYSKSKTLVIAIDQFDPENKDDSPQDITIEGIFSV